MENKIQDRAPELGKVLSVSELEALRRVLLAYRYDTFPEEQIVSLLSLVDSALGYALWRLLMSIDIITLILVLRWFSASFLRVFGRTPWMSCPLNLQSRKLLRCLPNLNR